jgi:cytochrome c biogenesis protein CcmG, thiol:disulfide interchange protein DsbE
MRRRKVLALIAGVLLLGWGLSMFGPLLGSSALEGEQAPDFNLPVVIGEGAFQDRLRLSDQRGKVVLLDFWASWCGPCRASVPMLGRVQESFPKDQVLIVGINSESRGEGLFMMVQKYWNFRYLSLHDPSQQTLLSYGVNAFPTMVLIDRDGIVQKVYPGTPTEAALLSRIKNLLD